MTDFGTPPFQDRRDAGRQLAPLLTKFAQMGNVVVLGLPRGGVPVAAEVAHALCAPLDVFVVRKLGMPGREELAIGAVASGGVCFWNPEVDWGADHLERVAEEIRIREMQELERRECAFRAGRERLNIEGKITILVDDGIATGSSMRAALEGARQLEPERLVVASPVGAECACASLAEIADEVQCLLEPQHFNAVGEYYTDFSPTSDEEVRELLAHGT